MAMPVVRTEWTVEMLDELPDDGNRYELIDGELFVTPAPSNTHQLIVLELATRIKLYLRGTLVARTMISPADVRRGDRTRNRVQPDVYVVELAGGAYPPDPFDLSDLLLAVEVLSPTNSKYDCQTKRELYLAGGVAEYWAIDPEAQTFTRWRGVSDPGEVFAERIEWQPNGIEAPLVIELREFFKQALE